MPVATPLSALRRLLKLRQALVAAPWVILAGVVAALALRFTVRDQIPYVATLYYGSPPGVVAIALGVAALWIGRRGHRWLGGVLAVLALAGGVWQIMGAWGPGPTPAPDADTDPVRVLLWNAQHGRRGWPGVAATIRAADADVVCLIEGSDDSPERRTWWVQEFGDYDKSYMGSGLILLVRGQVDSARRIRFEGHARTALIEVTTRERSLRLLMVDVKSNAIAPRIPLFERMTEALPDLAPDLVLGDFNTPLDSIVFDDWRTDFTHAFEAAGSGYGATWPSTLPVLTIDHAWAAKSVRVLATELRWGWASDHRPVVIQLALRD